MTSENMNVPERLWAWCFNPPKFGGWDDLGGYARPNHRKPMCKNERATGAEYVRADLFDAVAVENDVLRAEIKRLEGLVSASLPACDECGEAAYVALNRGVYCSTCAPENESKT